MPGICTYLNQWSDTQTRHKVLTFLLSAFPQHLFSKLPPELRLKIWEYNLPEPRIVSVRCGAQSLSPSPSPSRFAETAESTTTTTTKWPRNGRTRRATLLPPPPSPRSSPSSISSPPGWCTSPAPIPANLHACHESRAEALRRYALMFGIGRQPGHVFFDPCRDVLFFGPRDGYMAADAQMRTLLVLADPAELARVRRVALSEAVFTDVYGRGHLSSPPTPDHIATNLAVDVLHQLRARLPRLDELILVLHDGVPTHSGTGSVLPSLLTTWQDAQQSEPYTRLACQTRAAMARVCAAAPDWTPPRWRILAVRSSSPPDTHRQYCCRGAHPGTAQPEVLSPQTTSISQPKSKSGRGHVKLPTHRSRSGNTACRTASSSPCRSQRARSSLLSSPPSPSVPSSSSPSIRRTAYLKQQQPACPNCEVVAAVPLGKSS